MNKLEAIRDWAEDKESPIICFVNGTDPEVIKIAKVLIQQQIADVLLFGEELEVYDLCRIYRLNETMLYGVINPADHHEIEYYTEMYMEEFGEDDAKKAAKAIKNPEVLADLMFRDEAIDLIVSDLSSWKP